MSSSETMLAFDSSCYSTRSSSYISNRTYGQIRLSTPPRVISGPKSETSDGLISFEKAWKQLQGITSSDSSSLSLAVSPTIFDQIINKLGDYPELDNFQCVKILSFFLAQNLLRLRSFDYRLHENLLIIHVPNVGHEVISELDATFSAQKPDDVKFGGTALIRLSNGKKSPDFSIFSDRNPDRSQRFKTQEGVDEIVGCPAVVIEVGYSEKMSDLSEDCGRWIACSFGLVRLAIGIKIDYTMTTDKATHEVERTLNHVKCFTWQVEKVDRNTALLPGEKIDVLVRTDNHSGPATRFSCVQRLGTVLHRVHAFCRHTYQV